MKLKVSNNGNIICHYLKLETEIMAILDTNRTPKQALQYKPKGRRHIGRPRKR